MKKIVFLFTAAALLLLGCGTAERADNRQIDLELSDAIARGDLEAADRALKNGADINARYRLSGGHTVLTMTAGRSDTAIVEFLLDHGADPNVGSSAGRTALMQAAMLNRIDHVTLLLERGADPAAVSRRGETALSIARENNSQELVALLTDARRAM